jgi:hypothetical protein
MDWRFSLVPARMADQQWNPHFVLVQACPVAQEIMLTEAFSVIGRNDDQRLVRPRSLRDRLQESPEVPIHVGDLRIVASNPGGQRILLGRLECKDRP